MPSKRHVDPKITAPSVALMKAQKQKIVALTCYDYTTAQLLNAAGVDILLIGDSLGMVKLGLATTLPVTMEDIVYHTRIVARGNTRALVVADMPYLSYHASLVEAVRNAGRLLKNGAEAVKIEGGREMMPVVKALQAAKIPVMGHLGLTPQSIHLMGGFKVQGRTGAVAQRILADARALARAGVFSIVLEGMPAALAGAVTRAVKVPTIGIGAGAACDGQILVVDDLLGITSPPRPRFVKAYANLRAEIQQAAERFGQDVRTGVFPDQSHSYDA